MKDTCKQAIFRKDTRRVRRAEDLLRAGDQEERELEFFNILLNATNFFPVSFHHTLPVHAENTVLQNFLAPAWGSFTLEHMHIVVLYPSLSFLLYTHNCPLYSVYYTLLSTLMIGYPSDH